MKPHNWVKARTRSLKVDGFAGIYYRRCTECGIEVSYDDDGKWPFEPYNNDCDEQILRVIHES